ncbi:hypothetical protein CEXT_570571 [Caerostris extrusa]|uniref:Uncharacterized protein n=1 Tax=Caerostris extrusa TaxID=172846 RepID=A0AAV4T2B8_CAEEX|nr:hypothetical protein CEXT_570571 [Caerostris extrusa]
MAPTCLGYGPETGLGISARCSLVRSCGFCSIHTPLVNEEGGGNEIEGVEGGRLANLAILNIKSIQLCYDLRRDVRGRLKSSKRRKSLPPSFVFILSINHPHV